MKNFTDALSSPATSHESATEQVHALAYRVDLKGAQRLLAGLTEQFEQGVDLGPRGPQIRSLGLSLETLVTALRKEVARLSLPNDVYGLAAVIALYERLAALARTYETVIDDGGHGPDRLSR